MTNSPYAYVRPGERSSLTDLMHQPGAVAGAALIAPAAISAYRFVTSLKAQASPGDSLIIGVSGAAVSPQQDFFIGGPGIRIVEADCPLVVGNYVKVGSGGRATKHNAAASTLKADAAGVADDFTQPGAATALEILQASNQAADAGKVIRIEGADASGDPIYEDIALDGSDTTTVVAGTVEFTTICAAYTLDGTVVAADVTIRETDNTGVTTIPAAAASVGVVAPSEVEAHSSLITITGPDTDATFITILGIDTDGNTVRERLEMDAQSPAIATSTLRYRHLTSIFMGEATDSENFDLTVGPDTPGEALGYVLKDTGIQGDLAVIAFTSPLNLTDPFTLKGRIHVNLLDGEDGDPGTYVLTGIEIGDEIVFVGHFTTKASIASLADVTSDFAINDTDQLLSATDYSNDQLMVIWVDRTP